MNKKLLGYIGRFTLLHVITYTVAGVIFMNLFNYAEVFQTSEVFAHFRSIESPIMQAVPFLQIIRGAIFALILYPFYEVIVNHKRGWLILFSVLWGLTYLGSVEATLGSIEGMIYTKASLAEHLVGTPEVTIQMLVFAWLFVKWEKRSLKKRQKKLTLKETVTTIN
mgnify:CR=1 FL=1